MTVVGWKVVVGVGLLTQAGCVFGGGEEDDDVQPRECRVSYPCVAGGVCPAPAQSDIEIAALDSDGTSVFYQTEAGFLWRLVPGGEPEQLTEELGWSGETLLATDAGVYYVVSGVLRRFDGATETTTAILSGVVLPMQLVENADSVFIASLEQPLRMISKLDDSMVEPVTGTAVMTFVTFAVDDLEVYFTSNSELVAVSRSGGSMRTVVPETQAAQVVLTADRVFWTPHGQSLWSALKDGSDAEMVYGDYVTSLVVEGDRAYWLDSNGMGKSTFGRDGDVLFIAGDYARELKSDGGALWWAGGVWLGSSDACALMRFDLP